MYEIIPKRTNKAAEYVASIMIVTAFLAMFFTTLPSLPYRSVMQLAAMVMLAFSILMITRYTLSAYSYAVISADVSGEFDFTVTELKRKSHITVCRISLSSIEKVALVKASDKKLSAKLKASAKSRKRFNYCIDVAPSQYIYLFAEECGERIALKLSYDKKLYSILKEAAARNTQSNSED